MANAQTVRPTTFRSHFHELRHVWHVEGSRAVPSVEIDGADVHVGDVARYTLLLNRTA